MLEGLLFFLGIIAFLFIILRGLLKTVFRHSWLDSSVLCLVMSVLPLMIFFLAPGSLVMQNLFILMVSTGVFLAVVAFVVVLALRAYRFLRNSFPSITVPRHYVTPYDTPYQRFVFPNTPVTRNAPRFEIEPEGHVEPVLDLTELDQEERTRRHT